MITSYLPEVREKPEWVTFLVYQREICPSTQREHWQMYAEFDSQKSLKQIHEWMPGCHVQKRYGPQRKAIEYCTKEETRISEPVRLGEPKNQGERRDLKDCYKIISEDIAKKNPIKRAIDEHTGTMIRYKQNIMNVVAETVEPRDYKPTVKVFWGATGTGKSYDAHKELPEAYVWCPDHGKWWGSYMPSVQFCY